MKKIILGLLLFFTVSIKLSAQTQTQTDTTGMTRYWYYPGENYYYNDVTGDYWYWDQPTVKWMDVKKLPPSYRVTDTDDRYPVYYRGTDVWKDNKTHKTKYKVKKNGTIKEKPKNGTA
jgi:hypothetical protein